MKDIKKNWCLIIGLLIVSIVLVAKHLVKLPDTVEGLGLGFGFGLELVGVYSINHDMTKIKKFKKNLVHAFIK